MEDLTEIVSFLRDQYFGSREWVVSKYVEQPLLLSGGRKFDIRCWVLLDHCYDVYLYRQVSCANILCHTHTHFAAFTHAHTRTVSHTPVNDCNCVFHRACYEPAA